MAEMSAGERPVDVLDQYRRDADLSHSDLWLRYFGLGGMSNAMELEAFLCGALQPSAHDREVIAQALNERFVELGGNHPVPYAETDTERRSEEARPMRPLPPVLLDWPETGEETTCPPNA